MGNQEKFWNDYYREKYVICHSSRLNNTFIDYLSQQLFFTKTAGKTNTLFKILQLAFWTYSNKPE
jgi:hypothetical protein